MCSHPHWEGRSHGGGLVAPQGCCFGGAVWHGLHGLGKKCNGAKKTQNVIGDKIHWEMKHPYVPLGAAPPGTSRTMAKYLRSGDGVVHGPSQLEIQVLC